MTLQKLLSHPLIVEMVFRGIEPTIKAGGLQIEGFYKSGTVLLYMDDDGDILAHSRYNEVTEIRNLEDLVRLNHEWWNRSRARVADFLTPSEPWLTLMLEFGLIKKVEIHTVEYHNT